MHVPVGHTSSHSVSLMQVVLLSATIPVDVLEVTTKFMRDPIRILVKKEELSLEGIRQFYINVCKEVRGLVCSPNECHTQTLGITVTLKVEFSGRMEKLSLDTSPCSH